MMWFTLVCNVLHVDYYRFCWINTLDRILSLHIQYNIIKIPSDLVLKTFGVKIRNTNHIYTISVDGKLALSQLDRNLNASRLLSSQLAVDTECLNGNFN